MEGGKREVGGPSSEREKQEEVVVVKMEEGLLMMKKKKTMMMVSFKRVKGLLVILFLVLFFLSKTRLRKIRLILDLGCFNLANIVDLFKLNVAFVVKEDESLRRWKEKLLGCLESDLNGQMEPEVKFHSIGIVSSDFGEISTPFPMNEEQCKRVLFTLQEGSEYRLKLTFSVLHNIVSGLAYTNTVWKAGLKVDQSRGMLGTFAPQREPYVHTLEEETTPSGVLARGVYTAKLKFEDDDKRRHMELDYSFEIRKRS
ncbi:UNVERIFIED_CONTAM: Rho GDP-dissociation inhibitor 1 [Sesamum calycinum]|uniref:Rho GDP-dissociation inhibitor 1 n=1 Tax=Sesamum calycinum TaxID=2727403 RepID=A0AAW2SEK2_9LAMI